MNLIKYMIYKRNNIDIFRAFNLVCQNCSLSETAKIMHISPSSISLYIKQIENSCGRKLFVRNGNKFIMNNLGVKINTMIIDYLNCLNKINNIIDEIKKDTTISIATHYLPMLLIILPIIKLNKTPFIINEYNRDIAIVKLLNHEINFAIYPLNDKYIEEISENLVIKKLWRYEAMIVCHEENNILNKNSESITINDLTKDMIGSTSGSASQYIEENAQYRVNVHYSSLILMIKALKGLTCIDKKSKLVLNCKDKEIRYINIDHLFQDIHYCLIYNKHRISDNDKFINQVLHQTELINSQIH